MPIFVIKNGQLYDWTNGLDMPTIKIGDNFNIEYDRLSIKSYRYDWLGKNEIMAVSYIKSNASKKSSNIESVVYYDKNADVSNRFWKVSEFDNSEYGYDVIACYKSFLPRVISITNKVWSINKGNILKWGLGLAKTLLMSNPYAPIINIGVSLIVGNIRHVEVFSHTIEFRFDDDENPIYLCKYVCLDHHVESSFENDYKYENGKLINIVTEEEYSGGSYIILDVNNDERNELEDFDFLANSAEVIRDQHIHDQDTADKVLKKEKELNDYNLFLDVLNEEDDDKRIINAKIKSITNKKLRYILEDSINSSGGFSSEN